MQTVSIHLLEVCDTYVAGLPESFIHFSGNSGGLGLTQSPPKVPHGEKVAYSGQKEPTKLITRKNKEIAIHFEN